MSASQHFNSVTSFWKNYGYCNFKK